jgi:hypothetical protein
MTIRAIVVSTTNNKLKLRTKGGTKLQWSMIPHVKVGDEVHVFVKEGGKVINIEPISCKHEIETPVLKEPEAYEQLVPNSELESEHDEL